MTAITTIVPDEVAKILAAEGMTKDVSLSERASDILVSYCNGDLRMKNKVIINE